MYIRQMKNKSIIEPLNKTIDIKEIKEKNKVKKIINLKLFSILNIKYKIEMYK